MKDTEPQLELQTSSRVLSAYLLGTLEFDALIALQRRLIYDVGGDRTSAAIILCDHPTGITIGREGSWAHVRPNLAAVQARLRACWRPEDGVPPGEVVRWVSRGGGVMLHVSGQVACYPILPLNSLGLTVARYLEELQGIVIDLLREFNLVGTRDPNRPGVRVNGRRVAHLGVAVRDQITAFGLVLNATTELEPFHEVACDGDPSPMTSIQREAAGRVRTSGVRQRLLELIAARFGFERVSIFHTHPGALPRPTRHGAA